MNLHILHAVLSFNIQLYIQFLPNEFPASVTQLVEKSVSASFSLAVCQQICS